MLRRLIFRRCQWTWICQLSSPRQVLATPMNLTPDAVKPPLTAQHLHTIQQTLKEVLSVPEASSLVSENKSRELCNYYEKLIPEDRTTFLKSLATEYVVDHSVLQNLASGLPNAKERGPGVLLKAQERLRQALVPRYQLLFTQISRLESGVKFLVDLRTDILNIVYSNNADRDNPYLQALNTCLRDLLSLWFSVGFLQLERVTWESPCDMVQKISDYEAVHPIRNWLDLKRRMGTYRRCFVFTHRCMPREPVVVLHTALTGEISASIQSIVQHPQPAGTGQSVVPVMPEGEENPNNVTTAIFYSITSTQKGLQGVDLGNYLIKSAVKELQSDFPRISQYSSLSPIPGFKDWLVGELNKQVNLQDIGEEDDHPFFLESEVGDIKDSLGASDKSLYECLKKALQNNHWVQSEPACRALKAPLLRLCARYLYVEKRRGFAVNPVANFHLRNGAVMWRLNWLADITPRGLGASCGLMVNYRYYLEQLEENSKHYVASQQIAVSDQVLKLVDLNPGIAQPNAVKDNLHNGI